MFKKALKRGMAMVLSAALLVTGSYTVMAADEIGEPEERISFDIFETKYDVTDLSKITMDQTTGYISLDASLMSEKVIVIPKSITVDGVEKEVKGIAANAFANMTALETVIIPDSLTYIGEKAFENDAALSKMLTYSDEQIGAEGTQIGFKYPVENPEANEGDPKEYKYEEVDGITLPSAMETVFGSTFIGCSQIKSFNLSDENAFYNVVGENKEALVTEDGKKLVVLAPGFAGDMYSLPAGIETVGSYACYNNGTNNGFVVPNTVKTIEAYAFVGIRNQGSFTFEDGSVLETIGDWAFSKANNMNLVLPATVKTIGKHVFDAMENPQALDISKTQIVNIPEYAFANQPTLHSVDLPKSAQTIASYAFANCGNLDTVNFLGDTFTSIGANAFYGCRTFHEIDIPEGVKKIEADTFNGCGNLGIVKLPDSLEEIGPNAFKDCVTIHEMVIPEGVKVIDKTAFSGARTDLIDASKNPTAAEALGQDASKIKAALSAQLKGKVLTVGGYKYKVLTTNAKGGTVALVGAKKKTLKKVTVKSTVSYKYKNVKFTYKVTTIGSKAFARYKKLSKVTIGKNVKTIGKSAFANCKKLKSVVIKSKKLKKIGKKAFAKKGGKKITFKVPKKKKKAYKKLLKRAKTKKYKVK